MHCQKFSNRPGCGTIAVRMREFDGPEIKSGTDLSDWVPGEVKCLAFAGADWEVVLTLTPVPARTDAFDGSLSCRVVSGEARGVNAALEWEPSGWSPANFVMLPAAAYDGNRFPARYQTYSPIARDASDLGPNAASAITDVPRLERDPKKPSRLHVLTGDLTTPAITYFSPGRREGGILLTDQGTRWGNHGLVVEEDAGHERAVLRVEAPGVRQVVYTMMKRDSPSEDRGADVCAGQSLDIRFRLFVFLADDVQDLYDRFAVVRKDLSGPETRRHLLPFSAAWAIQEAKYNQHNWNPAGYYTVGVRHDWEAGQKYQDWQLGWVGGGMSTLPLLAQGGAQSRERALRTLDWIFTAGTALSGMPYPTFHAGRPYPDHPRPKGKRWTLVRKLGDGLYFLLKQFDLLWKQDAAWRPPARWTAGVRAQAEGLIRVFETNGQLGQFLDWDNWDIVVGGSTSGAIVPGALALAGQWFGEERYLEAAARIARDFCDRDLARGVTTGGPGEILQCPDSESAFALLESLVVLFELTGDRDWLPLAEAMATQCLTWCASYDYQFPAGSVLGRLDTRAAGSVWANVQNKHSSPGICTFSGDSLFKLWRATGNPLYLDQILETAHNLPQYLSRADRPVGNPPAMRPGFMCERVNFSDWEGRENVGGMLFGSCWCEVSLMLTTLEIPGIYLQPDTGFLAVFDHVDATVVEHADSGLTLQVTNPTSFDADVTIVVENATDTHCVWGQNALHDCPRLFVPAGGTCQFARPSLKRPEDLRASSAALTF